MRYCWCIELTVVLNSISHIQEFGFTFNIITHTSLCCVSQLKQFQKDNADVGFGSASKALQQAIEKTTARITWLAENKEQILKWFISETV